MTMTVPEAADRAQAVVAELDRIVVGRPDATRLALIAMLAGSHILIEDLPGLGKTLLARSLAAVLGLRFTRVQHTPDLLPADLTGATVFNQVTGAYEFRPGPVFTDLLLADEVNRTPPKTQAALLEAMAEHQVSVDGETHPLSDLFTVLATQNPIEYEGTYPLPEAQLDRFGVRVRLGYLQREDEHALAADRLAAQMTEPTPARVADADTVRSLRHTLGAVHVDDSVVAYAVDLVTATRTHPQLELGSSPRGTLTLLATARAAALLGGRDYVVPDDVAGLALPVLAHRVVLRPELWARRVSGDDVITDVLDHVPAPTAEPTGGARAQ
jgi:MoxR-like ATPase